MKRQFHPLIAAAVAACLAVPAFASAPATSTEAKQFQPDQVLAKGKKAKSGKSKKAPPKA